MSIPLDRLYHYIESLCSDNTIIYRWLPHGSKNLNDLQPLFTYDNIDWKELMTSLPLICHDQEPLDFNRHDIIELDELCNAVYYDKLPQSINSFIAQLKHQMHIYRVCTLPLTMYDQLLLCNSEKNSTELDKFESNGFIGVYYWAHAIIARDWFRYAEHDSALVNTDFDFDNDFLIYNRAWAGTREYRLKFAELLLDNNLVHTSNIKFNPVDNNIHYTQHKFANEKFTINNCNLDQSFELNSTSSSYSADYDSNDYKTSGIEVVLETLFDDSRLHLTEKSLRPIACGKPFILVATAYSLQYLRDYGFKTFNGLIDESYDSMQDPLERLTAIIAELKRIATMPASKKQQLWRELHVIADYNKHLFFSREWEFSIIDELKSNLSSAFAKATQHSTGKYWRQIYTEFKDERGTSPNKKYIDNWLKHRGHGYDN
jgi:hypothetical protein